MLASRYKNSAFKLPLKGIYYDFKPRTFCCTDDVFHFNLLHATFHLQTEYTGELINAETEMSRMPKYWSHRRCYIFNVNNNVCIDAFWFGNKSRFFNNASTDEANCYARVS